MDTTRISPATTCKSKLKRNAQSGFTLIEIMVVVGIIAFVAAIAIPRLGKSLGTQLRTTTRKIAILNKELHHFARLRNKTYRLVVSFGDLTHKPALWVESASTKTLLSAPDATPTPEPHIGDKKPTGGDPFSFDTEVLKKPIELPEGCKFEDVQLDPRAKPVVEGKAFVHFFPEGLVQQAVIHVTDGNKLHWSLIINPLTGYTDILTERREFRDIVQ